MSRVSLLLWIILLSAFPYPAIVLETMLTGIAWLGYGCVLTVSWMLLLLNLTLLAISISM